MKNLTTTTRQIGQNLNLEILLNTKLTSGENEEIRSTVTKSLSDKFDTIYIDTQKVTEVDLSGINEIIHSYFVLKNNKKKLVLVYRKNSSVDQWVNTTKLNRFIGTAILPEIQ